MAQTSSVLGEREQQAALMMEVSRALIQSQTLPETLRRCTEALVQHLGGAFARIWTLDEADAVLVLQASSGLYTHLNGEHSRVPVGKFKIGLIAEERRPHLTNSVLGDARVSDQEWARREGMIAFAGYPLVVEERLVGVMALFARKPLTDVALESMSAVANAIALGIERKGAEEELVEKTRELETLHRIGALLAGELDLQRLVQLVTDEATTLCGAQFGSFFYNTINAQGESYVLYTISGVPREAFSRFPMPRNTAVFAPTFEGEGVVRSDDITQDARYGRNAPYHGMPQGHLPVRSYLAVPVMSRTGEVIGGLFFGHPEPGVFSARHEKTLLALAAQTAMAMDNARLYATAQQQIAERSQAEAHVRELNARLRRSMTETHHRVKNNLQLVSALLEMQSQARDQMVSVTALLRLKHNIQALGIIHDILTYQAKEEGTAETLSVRSVLDRLIPLLETPLGTRRLIAEIEDVSLSSKQATSVAIAANELISNATKYGRGDIELTLRTRDDEVILEVCDDGPGFAAGFDPETAANTGLELIENIVAFDLSGEASYENREQGGARIVIVFPLPSSDEDGQNEDTRRKEP